MPTAPENEKTRTAKKATKFNTWLGVEGGGDPLEGAEEPTYVPLVMSRSAGGASLDTAVFSIDLGKREERLTDMNTPAAFNREIEVRTPVEGTTAGDPVFWGAIASQSMRIDGQSESATITARIEPHHFGDTLKGIQVYDPLAGDEVRIDTDVFFNPLVDGKIINNMASRAATPGDWHLWFHPESIRTTTAIGYQDASSVGPWTITKAVHSLCWFLNPDQDYIKNPTLAELTAALRDETDLEVSNFWLRRGMYLPQCLDALLAPHGFNWFVKLATDSSNYATRKIVIFKRGVGDQKAVYMQRPGESLQLSETNTMDLSHDLSVADLVNEVEGFGEYEEREITIQLERGWLESEDALTPEDLDKTVDATEGGLYEAHPNAWRLFVANEANDYNGLRPEITDPIDFTGIFSEFVVKRRRFEDCLQLDSKGKRIPPIVEWYDPEETIWKVVSPGSYTVLNDQMGIMFNGATPPDDIANGGDDVAIRVTGTVTGDKRVTATASRQSRSPNASVIKLTLDVANRFFDRQVQTTGGYASVHNDYLGHGADERDDEADLLAYCEAARDVEDAAQLRTPIVLHGIHRDYEIGDLIGTLQGRDISFNRLADGTEDKRYPQIVGIAYDTQRQTTTLAVEPVEDKGYERDGSFGGPIGKKLRMA